MPFPPLPPDALDLDRDLLVRVEAPAHVHAVAGSAEASVLLSPPTDGTPWSWETVPWLDQQVPNDLDVAVNLTPWHQAGATGGGVRVAVFDLQWFGVDAVADTLQPFSTHDCFAEASCAEPMDTLRPRFDFESGVHGTACAEIIRQVAPDAELFLVRVNTRTMFENAVDWAIANDIDVISMSMSWFNLSFHDGSGPMAPYVDRLVANDIVLVTSAGNYAQQHWQGPWVDANGDGRLDDPPQIVVEPGDRVYLSWNQFNSCGTTDLDVRLLDADGATVAQSQGRQDPDVSAEDCRPVERLPSVFDPGTYTVDVRHVRGPTSGLRLDLMVPGGAVVAAVPESSIVDPGLHPGVLTIGAVDVSNYLRADAQGYSSRGPSLAGSVKPDLAGPDGLTTQSYGSRGFFGTSASTPVVAGMLAVVLSEEPGLTGAEAADRLRGWSWASGDSPRDVRWGFGKARLPTVREERGCGNRPSLLVFALLWLPFRRRSG
ncbi:MAG: S8 family serine peptidase [Myxococcota bacterium]